MNHDVNDVNNVKMVNDVNDECLSNREWCINLGNVFFTATVAVLCCMIIFQNFRLYF